MRITHPLALNVKSSLCAKKLAVKRHLNLNRSYVSTRIPMVSCFKSPNFLLGELTHNFYYQYVKLLSTKQIEFLLSNFCYIWVGMINFLIVAVKLDLVKVVCVEPNCMKIFTNEQGLREHIQLCHRYITCQVCGAKQLKKNINRHLKTHEEEGSVESIKCNYKGYDRTFSTVRFKLWHKVVLTLEKKIQKFEIFRVQNSCSSIYVYTFAEIESQSKCKGCILEIEAFCLWLFWLRHEIFMQVCDR